MRKVPIIIASALLGTLALAGEGPAMVPNRPVVKFPGRVYVFTPPPQIEGIQDGPDVIDSRRCTRGPGSEMQVCTDRCANSGTGVIGCQVGTVGGKMTETCTCGNPNDYV